MFGGLPRAGGTEAVMENIYKNINRKIYSIDFLFLGRKTDDCSEFSKMVSRESKIFYACTRSESLIKNHKNIKNVLISNHYDIVHSHMDACGDYVLKIAKDCGVKVRIAHSHNTGHLKNVQGLKDSIHRLVLDIERFRIRMFATHFVACSSEAGRWLFGKNIDRKSNYLLFKNAIDVNAYKFDEKVRNKVRKALHLEKKKIIGHVGRFEYQKNHPYLIEVFKNVHLKEKDTVLLLIGEGRGRANIEKLVEDAGLEKAVRFLGMVSNVNEVLQAMDIFVMPSYYEGLSVALVEAQASGLSCIVSDTVSPESDISGNVDFLDIGLDADKWSDKILSILRENKIRNCPREQLQKKGFDMITNIHTLENFYKESMKDN